MKGIEVSARIVLTVIFSVDLAVLVDVHSTNSASN